jgi:hypothetical protein
LCAAKGKIDVELLGEFGTIGSWGRGAQSPEVVGTVRCAGQAADGGLAVVHARMFGGDNTRPENFVPLYPDANRIEMRSPPDAGPIRDFNHPIWMDEHCPLWTSGAFDVEPQ